MTEHNVFILDAEQDFSETISKTFENRGFKTQIFTSIPILVSEISSNNSQLILTNYQTIASYEREQVIHFFSDLKKQNIVVFNVPANASRRLAFYELGAARVYDVSLQPDEVCYSLIWYLNSLAEKKRRFPLDSGGRIENLPLDEIVLILGHSERNGILKINSAHNSGTIQFYNGQPDSAHVGIHTGEKAILHMMMWREGTFSFSSVQESRPQNDVCPSSVGLLILAKSIREKYHSDLLRIGPLSTIVRGKNPGDILYNNRNIIPDFISYLQQPRPLAETLENAFYSNFETAEILKMLFLNNFLICNEPAKQINRDFHPGAGNHEKAAKAPPLTSQQIGLIRDNLSLTNEKQAKIFLMSNSTGIRQQFIDTISKNDIKQPGNRSMNIVQLNTDDSFEIFLVGTAMDHLVFETLENIADGLNGYIFLMDSRYPQLFEYNSYYIKQVLKIKKAPTLAAVTHVKSDVEIDAIKSKFFPEMNINWLGYNPDDPLSANNVLTGIMAFKEEEEKTENIGEQE